MFQTVVKLKWKYLKTPDQGTTDTLLSMKFILPVMQSFFYN